jgi:uncharacterized membrane protein YkvA (DUF1232 family)
MRVKQRFMNVDSPWLQWLNRARSLLVVAVVLCAAVAQPAAALSAVRWDLPGGARLGLSASVSAAPGMLGHVHRLATRSERALSRLTTLVASGLSTWFGVLLSAALFLFVSAIASATDVRMFALGHQNAQVLARDLLHGVRMFFRILRDRRTPFLPRVVVVLALLYWLLPADLLGDAMPVVGMLDDLLIAVLAAKLFIYLCPDTVVAAHAAALRTDA